MIIWRGGGLFVVIFVLICVGLEYLFGIESSNYSGVFTCFVAGILSYVAGKIFCDKDDTLFWIPVEWWGVILIIGGIIRLAQNSILWAIGVVGVIGIIISVIIVYKKRIESEEANLEIEPFENHELELIEKYQSESMIPEETEEEFKKSVEKEDCRLL
ncbi:MAG: hypothetical protein FWD60_04420 [Candidatus Azobacteroides sp.]|nr:hypothetical protein [Candidatus Azobacteroides sp.]